MSECIHGEPLYGSCPDCIGQAEAPDPTAARLALYEGLPWDEIEGAIEYLSKFTGGTGVTNWRALLTRIQEVRGTGIQEARRG